MINTKNFRTSINSDEPEIVKVAFPGSKKIKTPKNLNYPYFTALELDHIDNKQKDLEQTNVKVQGSGFKTIKKVVKNVVDKNKDKVVDKVKTQATKELKKQASNQIDNLIGHLKSNNDELAGGKLHLKKLAKKAHIERKVKNIGKNVILPVAKEAAKTALKETAKDFVESNPEYTAMLPVANVVIEKGIGSGIKKKPNQRAAIVKKIMQEKGLSLIESSKYVKLNNLYNKNN